MATADTTTAAAAGERGGPSLLEPPFSLPKHDPVCGARHGTVARGTEEQQREAQLQNEEQQREAQQLKEEQQREALLVPASGAGCGAGAATAAATKHEFAAGGFDGTFSKQASDEARIHGAGCGSGAATAAASTNEAATGGCERPFPKQAAAAADAGVLDGPSPFEPASASATDSVIEAAVAGLVAKSTYTTMADSTTAATAGVQGRPSPLEPTFAQPKHDPVRGAGHASVAGDDEEQQRGAQLKDDAHQQEAQKLKAEQQQADRVA
jgi:hypothetical protein